MCALDMSPNERKRIATMVYPNGSYNMEKLKTATTAGIRYPIVSEELFKKIYNLEPHVKVREASLVAFSKHLVAEWLTMNKNENALKRIHFDSSINPTLQYGIFISNLTDYLKKFFGVIVQQPSDIRLFTIWKLAHDLEYIDGVRRVPIGRPPEFEQNHEIFQELFKQIYFCNGTTPVHIIETETLEDDFEAVYKVRVIKILPDFKFAVYEEKRRSNFDEFMELWKLRKEEIKSGSYI